MDVKIALNGKKGAKISLPEEILEALDASVGARVVMTPCGNGTVLLQKLIMAKA